LAQQEGWFHYILDIQARLALMRALAVAGNAS
jgi:hypothetical protein